MKIGRKSLYARYTHREIAAVPQAVVTLTQGMHDGAYQLLAHFTAYVKENGKQCAYHVDLTLAELQEAIAELERRTPAPEAKPLNPAPDLDAAIAKRMKKIDAAAKRREAQLRGDGSPN
jgi:hypothetical protein